MDEKMELNEAEDRDFKPSPERSLPDRFWSGGMGRNWLSTHANAWHQQWSNEGILFNPWHAGDLPRDRSITQWNLKGKAGTIKRFLDDLDEKLKAFNEVAAQPIGTAPIIGPDKRAPRPQVSRDIEWVRRGTPQEQWASDQAEKHLAGVDKERELKITLATEIPTGAA